MLQNFAEKLANLACLGDARAIASLLSDESIDVNECDMHGDNALMLAAREGQLAVIETLARFAPRIDAERRNGVGHTAAMAAANAGRIDALRLLVARFAVDLLAFDDNDYAAIHLAAASGHANVAAALVDEFGVHVDWCIGGSKTALHCAAQFGHADCVQALLVRGAAVDAIDQRFRSTPLVSVAVAVADFTVGSFFF